MATPRLACAGAFVTLAGLLIGAGCVDDDPIVSGKRPTAVADAAPVKPVIAAVGADADAPDIDAPDCRLCAETLDTNTARGTLCRKNNVNGSGSSSTRLLNALVDCVCYDKCIEECGTYCAGSTQTNPCRSCIASQCGESVTACLSDVRP